MTKIPTARELLELDIDLRLHNLWAEMMAVEGFTIETVGSYIRVAYGLGYIDALKESPEERGELCRRHGYTIPGQAE